LSSGVQVEEARAIRVLTLNAHQGFGARRRHAALLRIRQGLRQSGADLVMLQEIGVSAGAPSPASQYEILADEVWPAHAYGRNAVVSGGHHGNALLSKFPIADWQNVDLSVGKAEPRGMLHCSVKIPWDAGVLHAVCVHLALRESHRRRQVQRLAEFVSAEVPAAAPLVVAGDFNDWREIAHRRITAVPGVELMIGDAGGRPPRTFPAHFPVLRLDRIYGRNLRHRPVALPRRAWNAVSDHLALVADVWAAPA
jgi:endonuclease/exonuclease/phosphatase family metal-dependent hydrolase